MNDNTLLLNLVTDHMFETLFVLLLILVRELIIMRGVTTDYVVIRVPVDEWKFVDTVSMDQDFFFSDITKLIYHANWYDYQNTQILSGYVLIMTVVRSWSRSLSWTVSRVTTWNLWLYFCRLLSFARLSHFTARDHDQGSILAARMEDNLQIFSYQYFVWRQCPLWSSNPKIFSETLSFQKKLMNIIDDSFRASDTRTVNEVTSTQSSTRDFYIYQNRCNCVMCMKNIVLCDRQEIVSECRWTVNECFLISSVTNLLNRSQSYETTNVIWKYSVWFRDRYP